MSLRWCLRAKFKHFKLSNQPITCIMYWQDVLHNTLLWKPRTNSCGLGRNGKMRAWDSRVYARCPARVPYHFQRIKQNPYHSIKIDISNKVNPPSHSFFLLFWKGVATGMMFLLAWPGDYAQKLHQPWKVHSCGGRYNVWCFRLIPEFLICWSWCGMDFLIELWFEVYQLNVYEVAEGSNLLGHELPTSQPIRCHPRVTDPNNPRIWMMQYQHAYWAITLELQELE